MLARVDSFRTLEVDQVDLISDVSQKFFIGDSLAPEFNRPQNRNVNLNFLYSQAIQRIETAKNSLVSLHLRLEYLQQEQNKYLVETHKKYSIPFACIVFILIGPPLGMMMRKGGFGMAASVSLFFFLIYWAFLIGGEKLADRGFVTPFWGMWSANILMAVIGMYLIYKTSKQMLTIDFSRLKKLIPKRFRHSMQESDENS
jgi:lipopolysaccharide export system permease protein